jgi:hypothetical protein
MGKSRGVGGGGGARSLSGSDATDGRPGYCYISIEFLTESRRWDRRRSSRSDAGGLHVPGGFRGELGSSVAARTSDC